MDSEAVHAHPGLPGLATGLWLETPQLVLRQERVISLIRPANAASIRVAEKIGQRHQGSLELFEQEALIYAIP